MLRTHYIEKLGTGINRINQALLDAGLRKGDFQFSGFFSVCFNRAGSLIGGLIGGQTGGQKLSEKQSQLIDLIIDNPHITRAKLVKVLDINASAVQKHIDQLKNMKILKREGGSFGGYWVINTKNIPTKE